MPKLFLDYETANELDLGVVGVHNYVKHKSNRILLAGYALDDEPVEVQELPLITEKFRDAMYDPAVQIVAWNATFERLQSIYGLHIKNLPPERFLDPMIQARHLSMPGKLEKVCEILKLSDGKLDAKKLKKLFCQPAPVKKRKDPTSEFLFEMGIPEVRFHDHLSHPVEWKDFIEYCRRDVEVLREIYRIFEHHPLPESERLGWILDQKINDRGVPVDLELVQKMDKIATEAKKIAFDKIKIITNVENPNSGPQLLEWLKTQGYPYSSLDKSLVTASLDDIGMSDQAQRVLELRRESSKTSDSKLEALKLMISPDGCVRDLFGYLGAPRTGRWNSHGPQFANQPRPIKKVEAGFDRCIELILSEDYDKLRTEFGSVMDVIVGCIRGCYKAPVGCEFAIADYSSIEPRILGWLTNCQKINDIFKRGEDPYLRFAEALYGIPYEKMVIIVDGKHECRPEYKEHRQMSKPGFLGCGYMLSGGDEYTNKNGDLMRSGVWGYAKNQMNIDMPKELAHKSVRIFRDQYKEVVDFWYNSDDVIKQVIRTGRAVKLGRLGFDLSGQTLRMELPSGRYLHYIRPKIQQEEFRGKTRDQITFEGMTPTKQWLRQSTHPGRITENAVSGIARDCLLEGMKLADSQKIDICAHVHDEIVAVGKINEKTLDNLLLCMRQSIHWAPGLILDAAGFNSIRYRKG